MRFRAFCRQFMVVSSLLMVSSAGFAEEAVRATPESPHVKADAQFLAMLGSTSAQGAAQEKQGTWGDPECCDTNWYCEAVYCGHVGATCDAVLGPNCPRRCSCLY